MDAIVTAGGIPRPDDPLYGYSKGDSKTLIDVAGKPMVQWVLDALGGAKQVDNVILIGLSPKSGLTCKKPLHYLSNQGRMLANIVAGVNKSLELNAKTKYVLIVSADIPALRPEMVDWLVTTSMETKDDLYYGVCPREVMESRYPASNRTYTRLKDIELCGADINITHVRMATEHLDLWESLIGNRKSPLRQAATIGFDTLFQVATHSITLDDLVEKVCKRINIKGRAIVWDHAEPCMDVDKPHQLEILRADLAPQQVKSASPALKKTAKAKPAAKKAVKAKPAKTLKTSTKKMPTARLKSKTKAKAEAK
ncbi:MAG: nucleotidyltransferase family protein [Chloroflexi bacterium]|nr:nucleotidyltransferase family protein [Chloroflexota bacterium]